MLENQQPVEVPDEIKERYDGTSSLRQRALKILAEDDNLLEMTLRDENSSKLLIKLLDGEDKQTIARQKNQTDEKLVGAVGSNINDIAEAVITGLGGMRGIRGEADASSAPKEQVPIQVDVTLGELQLGEDPELNYDAIMNK